MQHVSYFIQASLSTTRLLFSFERILFELWLIVVRLTGTCKAIEDDYENATPY
jgi:hypothetical protein